MKAKKTSAAKPAKRSKRATSSASPSRTKELIVAIDGPAGSGKSTVTHFLARKLKYTHIDTGALYRGIALKAMESGVSLDSADKLGKIAEDSKLDFKWTKTGVKGAQEDTNVLLLDGKDVSSRIRTPEVSMAASKISAYPQVRDALLGLQRKLGEKGGVVLEGRDIGTVVFPNAHAKFYLTASVESRAQRRMIEMESKGIYQDFAEVKRQVAERDHGDMTRKAAPLRKADDAIEVDTTSMTVEQVVNTLAAIVTERKRQSRKK